MKECIIVTWDFTALSENAYHHALLLAEKRKLSIQLLHIVSKKKDVENQLLKLKEKAESFQKEFGVETEAIVQEGSIFKTINKVSESLNAKMVVMGTHGIKGMQKVTGSWALKVIVNSTIPFIVVQEKPKRASYAKALVVVDYKKENKQKMKWVQFLHKLFETSFCMLKPATKDALFLKQILKNDNFASKFMDTRSIIYDKKVSEGEKDFAIEIIEEAKRIEADLILVMTTKNIGFTDYALGAHEQYVIANYENIPVMCVNPDPNLIKYSGFG